MSRTIASSRAFLIAVLVGLLWFVLRGPSAVATSPKFFDDDPLWKEPHTQEASGAELYEPELIWDLAENLFTQPGDPDRDLRAQNINTVDEVPDGDWFVNRAGMRPLTPAEVARGANTIEGPSPGVMTIISAKSDGITPGFTVRDASGRTFFVKFDPPGYRGMATGTEVVAAKLFWALGFHTAEYYIIQLRPEELRVGEGAVITPPSENERPMKESDIGWLLKRADRDPDGSYRAIASLATPGKMVGRIRFYGTRPDDPNDVVPHEHRRELRGYGTFAAWLNHVDAKSINSIDMLVNENGRSFIRHYMLDFGSALGSAAIEPREHWEGYEYMLESGSEIVKGMAGFGFYILPWRKIPFYESPSIGRVPKDNTTWDPEGWRARVPNAAFAHARLDDKFWAATKVMAIDDEMIRAAVAAGQFEDSRSEEVLARTIIDRRDAIGKTYLPALNPVVHPELENGELRFENAAVEAGFATEPESYRAVWSSFDNATGATSPIGETSSVGVSEMPAPVGLPTAPGNIVKIEISASSASHPSWDEPVHVYFRREAAVWKLVGFERMPD